LLSVWAWRFSRVASFVSTTVAPGSTPPDGSETMPRRLPAFCAKAVEASTSVATRAMPKRPKSLVGVGIE